MEDEAHRVRVGHVDGLDDEEVVGAGAHLRIAHAVVGVFHVLGVELLAIVEPDAAAQVEDPLGRRSLLPCLGELGLGVERLVHPDQVLVDQGLPLLPDVEPLHVRLDARGKRGARVRQRSARWLGGGASGTRETERRRALEELAPVQTSIAQVVHGRALPCRAVGPRSYTSRTALERARAIA